MEDRSTAKPSIMDQKMEQNFRRMDDVEFLLRTGTFPHGCDKYDRSSIRRTSNNFVLKGDVLWYVFRGRMRRVLRREEEVREVLTHHHDNNDHAGQSRVHHAVTSLYYWGSIAPTIRKWVLDCETCRRKPVRTNQTPAFRRCIAYGCLSSSNEEGTTFHKFPRDDPQRTDLWLAVAQRDRWSIQSNVFLCSKHFTDDCFESSEEGRGLRPGAVPTLVVPTVKELLPPELEDEDEVMNDLITACNGTLEPNMEHQYALPPPETSRKSHRKGAGPDAAQTFVKEPCFLRYDALERYMTTGTYLTTGSYSVHSKTAKGSLRKLAKNFVMQDGVLMNAQRAALRNVPRSRKEANAVLKRFHDDQGHRGLTYTYRALSQQHVWSSMTRDLAHWIAHCAVCSGERESRKHQCSVYKCNNYSGPVERGLGLTFHPFPIHKPHLLSCWLSALGRASWFPRPRSVVCSGHFTHDCFDRSGGTAVLKTDAVPSRFLYQEPQYPGASDRPAVVMEMSQATTGDQAFFAKYDAVDRYIRQKIYPPGLTFVEKNTIRRFCKKFTIKDGLLHIVLKGRERRVLRSREEVNEVLAEFHDDLNHLDLKRVMRLLSERVFWGTMRADVARWIEHCSVCSPPAKKARREPEPEPEPSVRGGPDVREPQEMIDDVTLASDSLGRSAEEDDDDDDGGGGGHGDSDDEGGAAQQPVTQPNPRAVTMETVKQILVHQCLYSQQQNKVFLIRAADSGPAQAQPQTQTQPRSQTQTQAALPPRVMTLSSGPQPQPLQPQPLQAQPQTRVQTQTRSQTRAQTGALARGRGSEPAATKTSRTSRTGPEIRVSGAPPPSRASPPKPALAGQAGETSSKTPEPRLVLSSSKTPGPRDPPTAGCKPPGLRPAPTAGSQRAGTLQARTVIQQCSQALLKIRPPMDGAEAEWVEIQEGMVVYVCFFKGATEEIIPKMVDTLLSTKLFRGAAGQMVSVLELPGSVLLVPQDSLSGSSVHRKRVLHQEVAERWWGAQLYGQLVAGCERGVARDRDRKQSTDSAGSGVKHGIYGIRQEILMNSKEPFTCMLEF